MHSAATVPVGSTFLLIGGVTEEKKKDRPSSSSFSSAYTSPEPTRITSDLNTIYRYEPESSTFKLLPMKLQRVSGAVTAVSIQSESGARGAYAHLIE